MEVPTAVVATGTAAVTDALTGSVWMAVLVVVGPRRATATARKMIDAATTPPAA